MSSIKWLGHSSVKIVTGKGVRIYIDPWELSSHAEAADIILITHPHYDHYSPFDIRKISDKNTAVFGPAVCAEKLGKRFTAVRPGEIIELEGVKIEMYPAYNIDKPYHKRENDWMGFVIVADSERVYISGDTDFIPEMKDIKCDTAVLAVGGKYTMNVDNAVAAAEAMRPRRVLPVHYGKITGTSISGMQFKKKFSGRTIIPETED